MISATEDNINYEIELMKTLKAKQIPFIPLLNKIDLPKAKSKSYYEGALKVPLHEISCVTKQGIEELKVLIGDKIPTSFDNSTIVGDLLKTGDICVLVTPIDKSAPKGRLILPQVQTIRDILDNNGIAIVTKERELKTTLEVLSKA